MRSICGDRCANNERHHWDRHRLSHPPDPTPGDCGGLDPDRGGYVCWAKGLSLMGIGVISRDIRDSDIFGVSAFVIEL